MELDPVDVRVDLSERATRCGAISVCDHGLPGPPPTESSETATSRALMAALIFHAAWVTIAQLDPSLETEHAGRGRRYAPALAALGHRQPGLRSARSDRAAPSPVRPQPGIQPRTRSLGLSARIHVFQPCRPLAFIVEFDRRRAVGSRTAAADRQV